MSLIKKYEKVSSVVGVTQGNCCGHGCIIINDTECDPPREMLSLLEIIKGSGSNGFKWSLHSDGVLSSTVLTYVGEDFDDEERLNIQLCLSFPQQYYFNTSTDTAEAGEGNEWRGNY